LVNRIFDPYFTTKDMGHGIGLAVCYSVVSKHDGHIAVKSRPGAGSTFYVYLPAAGAPAERRQVSAQPAAVSRERVLVMDDEEVVTRTLKRMLTKLGYDVEVTADGAQAVERYRLAAEQGRPFMAVILDLVVPGGMGGLETLERLRQLDAGVRAIVSSGYSTHPVMSEFLKHGFLAMIEKPYHLEELRTALETAKVGQG
jgi:CheY-like chemotaxis protein